MIRIDDRLCAARLLRVIRNIGSNKMPQVPQPSSQIGQRFAATIAALSRPIDARALPLHALHLVMAMRLGALFEAAGRDPVSELTTRYRSVTKAVAVLRFTEEALRVWPAPFGVNRPCCLALTPDETTIAALARCARRGDRAAFGRAIDGLVRADRHERLYARCVEAVAVLDSPS